MSSLALNYLINLLARRDYSEYEIRCKMYDKKFSEQEINEAIMHCQQKNWQNDRRFAENYLNYRANKGYGANRIRQELKQLKGIDTVIIEDVLSQSERNWAKLAEEIIWKKFAQYQNRLDSKIKQKIWRYMLSRGFYAEDFSEKLK